MTTHPLLPHLFRPARGGALGVILVFSILFTIAANASLLGLPLGLILISWYFKYAYFLFDSVVRGVDEPPVLDIQTLNPVSEWRPVAQVVVLAVLGAAVVLVERTLGQGPAVALGIMVALALPASIAVLGLEGHIFHAFSPRALWQLVTALGPWYVVVLGVIAGYAGLIAAWSAWTSWLVLRLVVLLYAILSVMSLLAGALYERRDALGLEVWHSPERHAERSRLELLKSSQRIVDSAYAQVRLGAHTAAAKILDEWLAGRGHALEDYQWLCERLTGWADSRHLLRTQAAYVDRLLRLQRNSEALDVVTAALRLNPQFRPGSAAATFSVASIAARGGAPGVARALLGDFGSRYAGDPTVAGAAGLLREVGE